MSDTAKEAALCILLSPREAAKALSICEKTLYTYTKAGRIPAVRIGRSVRYSLEDLKQWVRSASEKEVENDRNIT